MNRPLALAAALALPLVGLAATWGTTHRMAQQGEEWLVPIGGYDPRDLLRGHYVIYGYQWPAQEGETAAAAQSAALSFAEELCLHGSAPVIDYVSRGIGEDCANPVRSDGYGTAWGGGLDRGRLYVPQDKASALQSDLNDPNKQAMLRFRLRPDGHITPLDISFEDKPEGAEEAANDEAPPPVTLTVSVSEPERP